MAKRYTFDDFINPERESKGIKRRLEIIDRNGHGKRPICRLSANEQDILLAREKRNCDNVSPCCRENPFGNSYRSKAIFEGVRPLYLKSRGLCLF